MKIVIKTSVPSQKNGKQIFINKRTGKRFITSSQNVKNWQEQALWQLKGQTPIVGYPVALTMIFKYDSKHRHDLDNSASTVLDILVKAGLLEDDNTSYVETLTLQYGGVDKDNAGVEVYVDN